MKTRSLSLGLLVTIIGLSAPHGALASDPSVPPQQDGNPAVESELGIYVPRDEALKPSLSACLKEHGLGVCLQKEMGPAPTNPEKTNSGLNPSWSDFLKKVIGVPQNVIQDGKTFGSVGGAIAISRITGDEIVADPNKLATDQKLGTPGVWTRHLIELVPQVGYERGLPDGNYVDGIFSFHGVLRITHRHPMDALYNDSFNGFTRSEIKILEQTIPTYIKVVSHIDGSGMLPGEGVEIERYGAIELGAGQMATLVADPSSWYVQAGVFGTAGPVMTFVRGHFRTIMEVQTDNTVRVALEKISENTEKFQGQIDLGVKFSPFTIMNSLANMETSFTQARKTILDMSFDTSFEPAAHALKMTYLGKYAEAMNLAAKADTEYQGVRLLQTSKVKEHTHANSFQIFSFSQSSSLTHDDINTTIGDDSTQSTVQSSSSKRKTLRSNRDMELTFQNSNGNSLNLKYVFNTKRAKPEEVREFVDLARVLGNTDQQAEAATFPIPEKAAKNKLYGYFYLSLDTQAFAPAMEAANGNTAALTTAWAKILDLPLPESWADLSEKAQDAAASDIPGAKNHLHHLRNFINALKKTLDSSDPDKQAQTFIKSFRGEGTDLYPLMALASLSDKSHVAVLETLRLHLPPAERSETPPAPVTLQIENIGSSYVNPDRLLY